MKLSITEVSDHLGVEAATVERWMRQGKLPGFRKGGTWFFRSKDLEKWAAKRNMAIEVARWKTPDKKESPETVPLSQALENGNCHQGVSGEDIRTVFTEAVDRIDGVPEEFKADLVDRLIEREDALSTGIGKGVAIPHPRLPLDYLDVPRIDLVVLDTPMPFNALDGQPVDLLFFILCPDLKFHLKLLSSLSFCLRDPEFCNFLRSFPDKAELVSAVLEKEAENNL